MKLNKLIENKKSPYEIIDNGGIKWKRNGGNLLGAPEIALDFFDCSSNNLESLVGSPKEVRGFFSCENNNLKSLEGVTPKIHGDLHIGNNPLKSLIGISDMIKRVIYIDFDHITTVEEGGIGLLLIDNIMNFGWEHNPKLEFHQALEIIKKYMRKPNRKELIFDCQAELVDAGLEAYAQI